MNRKWLVWMLVSVMLMQLLLTGCADSKGEQETSDGKTEVSVVLWGAQLLEDYAPWLQEQYPDVEFDFYIGNNYTEYCKYLANNGTLPDIVTVRKFSLSDVEDMKDQLLDLSDTELANSFYQSYLSDFTYSDGTVNWLPAAAELSDLLVNKTLFEENDIPLPTDWDSFVYACEEFEKLGIQGFAADFAMNYTCMNTLQGFSIGSLASAEGRKWREAYESGSEEGLDQDVWLPAFEKMLSLIECTGLNEDNLSLSFSDIASDFEEGKIAMIYGTGSEIIDYGKNYDTVLMPYPGDTEDESWYLTCPSFQVAANAACAEDSEREELIIDIMTTMLSEEGLGHISSGKNMVAYNRDVELELLDELSNLKPYIEENKMYLRIASSEMFTVSQDVVTKMLKGEITTAEEAYETFDSELRDDTEETQPVVMHMDRTYSHTFVNGSGNEAASAIYNTAREELGVDCMIGQSAIVGADILEGDYNETDLSYVTVGWDNGTLLKMDLTGSELKDVVQYMLDAKGTRDSVANNSTLPVASGFSMELTKNDEGYTVDKLTINGEEMSDEKTYSVVIRINYARDISTFEETGFTNYEKLDTKLHTLLQTRLIDESGQYTEPTDYITVK